MGKKSRNKKRCPKCGKNMERCTCASDVKNARRKKVYIAMFILIVLVVIATILLIVLGFSKSTISLRDEVYGRDLSSVILPIRSLDDNELINRTEELIQYCREYIPQVDDVIKRIEAVGLKCEFSKEKKLLEKISTSTIRPQKVLYIPQAHSVYNGKYNTMNEEAINSQNFIMHTLTEKYRDYDVVLIEGHEGKLTKESFILGAWRKYRFDGKQVTLEQCEDNLSMCSRTQASLRFFLENPNAIEFYGADDEKLALLTIGLSELKIERKYLEKCLELHECVCNLRERVALAKTCDIAGKEKAILIFGYSHMGGFVDYSSRLGLEKNIFYPVDALKMLDTNM